MFVIACTPKEKTEDAQIIVLEDHDDDGTADIIMLEETSSSVETYSDVVPLEKKDYKVVLTVDSTMYLGQSGMMEVWIGEQDIAVAKSSGMAQDQKSILNTTGRYATIAPYAPDFEIKEWALVCYKIDPNGSEIRFSLTPKDQGNYKVSAEINLYETEDCTGIPVPKTASALSVSVGVNRDKELSKNIHKMEQAVWDKFLAFWVALITLLFGTAIFVIRRYIKNKTGYDEGANSSQDS